MIFDIFACNPYRFRKGIQINFVRLVVVIAVEFIINDPG